MNVNFSMKHVTGALFVLLLSAAGVWAQTSTPAAAPAATKIASLDVKGAIIDTAEGKEAAAQLQSEFAPKENNLQNIQKQMDDIQSRLTNGATTLSDEEKARLQRQGDLLSHEFQRAQDDLQEELTATQQDMVDTIGRKILDVVDRYARENGISIVLDSSVQGGSVLYRSASVDITTDIVRLYDQAYPVKPAAAAAPATHAPAAAKPPAPQQ